MPVKAPAFAFALLTLAWVTCSNAQEKLQISAPSTWSGGWKQTWDGGGAGWRLQTYKPEGAEDTSLKDFITITSTWGGSQHDGITRLIRAWGLKIKGFCPNMAFVPPKPTNANEFTVGYAQFYCPKRSDSDEGSVDFVKAFASESNAHLVAVTRRTPSFTSVVPGSISYPNNADTEALVQWLKEISDYLQSVRACRGPSPLELKCSP